MGSSCDAASVCASPFRPQDHSPVLQSSLLAPQPGHHQPPPYPLSLSGLPVRLSPSAMSWPVQPTEGEGVSTARSSFVGQRLPTLSRLSLSMFEYTFKSNFIFFSDSMARSVSAFRVSTVVSRSSKLQRYAQDRQTPFSNHNTTDTDAPKSVSNSALAHNLLKAPIIRLESLQLAPCRFYHAVSFGCSFGATATRSL